MNNVSSSLGRWGFDVVTMAQLATWAKVQIFFCGTKSGGVSELGGSGWALTDVFFTKVEKRAYDLLITININ